MIERRIFGASMRRSTTNENTAMRASSAEAAPFPERQRGLAKTRGQGREVTRVALDPCLDVVFAKETANGALALLGLVDVTGERVSEVGDAVDERIAKEHGETEKRSPTPRGSRWRPRRRAASRASAGASRPWGSK